MSLSSPVDAVLFDLDGTLVDTIPLILASYDHTIAAHLPGYRPDKRLVIANLGRSLNAILLDYAVAAGVDDPEAVSAAMITTYRSFQRANLERLIRPYAGVREALAGLQEKGLRLGLVTSKVEWAARECYERYGLGQYLSLSVFHDDTERHKPDPEPLLFAVAKGGLDVRRTAYVGDSTHDMLAGRAAGMQTIGVLWGPSEREDLVRAGASAIAGTPADLLSIVPAPVRASEAGTAAS